MHFLLYYTPVHNHEGATWSIHLYHHRIVHPGVPAVLCSGKRVRPTSSPTTHTCLHRQFHFSRHVYVYFVTSHIECNFPVFHRKAHSKCGAFQNPLWRNWLARLTVTACSSESGGWKFEPSRRRIIFASRRQSKSGCGERRRSFCQRGSKRPEVSESPLTLTSRKNIE